MARFWSEKDKRKRHEIMMPDISRVTPYTLEECVERLSAYAAGDGQFEKSRLDIWNDEHEPYSLSFVIDKTFTSSEAIGRGMGIGRIRLEGTLATSEADNFTKVQAIAKASSETYLQWLAGIVSLGAIFVIPQNIPTDVYFFLLIISCIFFAYYIYQSIISVNNSKTEIINEIKQVLPKKDGSIE
jgi:hypothetical protein